MIYHVCNLTCPFLLYKLSLDLYIYYKYDVLTCMIGLSQKKENVFFSFSYSAHEVIAIQTINSPILYLTHVDAECNIIYIKFIFESQTVIRKDGKY